MSEVVHKAGGTPLRPVSGFASAAVGVAAGATLVFSAGTLAAETQTTTDEELTEITVTGSRIAQAVGMTTPTPVAAVSAEELAAIAPASITEALVKLPQFYNSPTAENFGNVGAGNGFFQSPGGGSLNLRGIGAKRTLTLLDGHRMVSSTAFGGPDINMFPDQMLKRVEAVTGGASAAYGTDAVSGVVNFILDTKFEGLRASAQAGISDRRDGENEQYSLSFGHALSDRSHVLFSASYSHQDDIVGYEGRDWYKGCGLMQNPSVSANVAQVSVTPPLVPAAWNIATYVAGNGGYSAATPRLVAACGLHNTQLTYDGLITVGTGATAQAYELQPNGGVIPFRRTLPASGPAASSAVMVGGGGQNIARNDSTVLPSSSRKDVFAYLDFDITDNFSVYGQGLVGWQALSASTRVGDFNSAPPQQFTIFRNNAFLPASLATIMDRAGVTSVSMTRAGTAEDWGTGSTTNNNRTYTATLGFKSTIPADGFFKDWSINGNIQYGRNKLDAAQEAGMRLDRVYLASDAVVDPVTGSIRCNVTLTSGLVPDCVPLNVFGRGNASPAAVDWIKGFDPDIAVTTRPFIGYDANGQPLYADETYSYIGDEDKHRLLTITQKLFEITASGKVAEGWAGPITTAFGVHWRKEGIDQKVQASQGNTAADGTYFPVWCPDNVVTTNSRCIAQVNRGIRPPGNIGVRGVPGNPYQNTVETQFSNVPFVSGSFDVKEVFTEAIAPLLSGQSWMQDLTFQGALRWADYTGSGSIWSYKAGLDAAFTNEIRLRGTYSHDTRAANISERFDRTGGFTPPINDRVTPLPAGWTNPTAVTTVIGGNPNLTPEEADTFTAGVVYTPNWLRGFDVSIDWLRVSLKNAIEQLPAQRVIDQCYFEGDQQQCARIVRDTTTNVILFVPQTYENLSKAYNESIDVEFGYSRKVNILGGSERVGLRVFGTYLMENSTTSSQGVKTDLTGNVALQYFEKKAVGTVNYSNGPFRWDVVARYNGGGQLGTVGGNYNQVRNLAQVTGTGASATASVVGTGRIYDLADDTIGASVYWDTRVGFNVPLTNGTLELFANVTNLLDRDPPLVLGEGIIAQSGGGFDEIGRRYVLGFNMKF
jgi:iron complex outermembrane recepter protein